VKTQTHAKRSQNIIFVAALLVITTALFGYTLFDREICKNQARDSDGITTSSQKELGFQFVLYMVVREGKRMTS
jgi:hypothetical protein